MSNEANAQAHEVITSSTLFVPEFRIEKLFHELGKLSRRAERLGLAPITFRRTGRSELREFTVTETWEGETTTRKENVEAVEVEVNGASPTLAGWQFVASIDQVTEGVNILNKAPFSKLTVPARFEACTVGCDHCQQERQRKSTFVLHHAESGDWKQVGRQCLRDFLGNEDPQALVGGASIFESYQTIVEDYCDFESEGGIGRGDVAWEISTILTITINVIAKHGFVSRKAAEESYPPKYATTERVLDVLFPPKTLEGAKLAESFRASAPEIDAEVAEIIAWVREQADESNDYLRNLRAAFSVDYCNRKRLGLVVSAVKGHRTHLEKLAEIARQKALDAAKKDEFFGEVGQRIELELFVLKLIDIESEQWGNSTLVIFEDAEGRAFKWFASNCWIAESRIGEKIKVVATIKGHEIYKDRHQTGLTRVSEWKPKVKKPRKAKAGAVAA